MTENRSRRLLRLQVLKAALIGIVVVLSARMLVGKPAPHVPKSIVSDWSHRYVRYKESGDDPGNAEFDKDPRREQSWYLRHPEAWWREYRHGHRHFLPEQEEDLNRDWSLNLGASTFRCRGFVQGVYDRRLVSIQRKAISATLRNSALVAPLAAWIPRPDMTEDR